MKTLYPILHDYINGMNGVANSGTGTLSVPGDYRYHNITLRTTVAGAAADPTTVIESIKLFGGPGSRKVQFFEATPSQLVKESKLYGIIPSTSECPLNFTDPRKWKRRDIAEMTSLDLHDQDDVIMKVKFLNPGGGAVGVTVLADFDRKLNIGPDGKQRLVVMKRVNYSEVLPVGKKAVTDISADWPLLRLYLTPDAGTITDVLLVADGRPVHQLLKAENQDALNRYGLDGTQFEHPIVFDKDAKLSSVLRAKNLILTQNSTNANTTTVHAVYRVNGFR